MESESKINEVDIIQGLESIKEESTVTPNEKSSLLNQGSNEMLADPKELEEQIISDEKIEYKEDEPIDQNDIKTELQTIAQILLTSLLNNEKVAKFEKDFQITLNEKQIHLITTIISSHPDLFGEIEGLLKNIIRDNKIDSKDIPDIMVLLQKIYEMLHSIKDLKFNVEKCTETTSILVKFVINVLIEEEIIKIDPNNRSDIQENLNKLIDVSMNLILLTTKMKPSFCKDLFFCFK